MRRCQSAHQINSLFTRLRGNKCHGQLIRQEHPDLCMSHSPVCWCPLALCLFPAFHFVAVPNPFFRQLEARKTKQEHCHWGTWQNSFTLLASSVVGEENFLKYSSQRDTLENFSPRLACNFSNLWNLLIFNRKIRETIIVIRSCGIPPSYLMFEITEIEFQCSSLRWHFSTPFLPFSPAAKWRWCCCGLFGRPTSKLGCCGSS